VGWWATTSTLVVVEKASPWPVIANLVVLRPAVLELILLFTHAAPGSTLLRSCLSLLRLLLCRLPPPAQAGHVFRCRLVTYHTEPLLAFSVKRTCLELLRHSFNPNPCMAIRAHRQRRRLASGRPLSAMFPQLARHVGNPSARYVGSIASFKPSSLP
jgi:hypothetical protein